MTFTFNQDYTGRGIQIENYAFARKFAPRIAFESDDGAGGGSGTTPPPAPEQSKPDEDVSGLKSALTKERDRAKDLEKQFAQLKESFKGIDPDKYQQYEKLAAEAEKANQREAELKQTLETQYTTQIQAEQKKAQEWEQQYHSLVKRTLAEKFFSGARGRTEAGEDGISFFDTVYQHVDRYLRISDKGEVEILDSNGVKRFSKKDASKGMSAIEFFEELHTHPVFGHCFLPASNAKGGGMQQSTSRASSQDLSSLPFAERVRLLRQQQR